MVIQHKKQFIKKTLLNIICIEVKHLGKDWGFLGVRGSLAGARSCSGVALKIAEPDTLRQQNRDKGDHLHYQILSQLPFHERSYYGQITPGGRELTFSNVNTGYAAFYPLSNFIPYGNFKP